MYTVDDDTVDPNLKTILLDGNKVGRWKKKMCLKSTNSAYSSFISISEVMSKNMLPLVECMTMRNVLEFLWLANRDQSMIYKYRDRHQKVVPHNLRKTSGKRRVQGVRMTYTHSPHILVNLDTKEGEIGEGQLIIPSDTKDKKASKYLKNKLKEEGLRIGRNADIGPNGLRIETSSNGWEQQYNVIADVRGLALFRSQCLVTDQWPIFKGEEFVDECLKNVIYQNMRMIFFF